MRKLNFLLNILAITFFFTGCGVISQNVVEKGQLYPKMYQQHPKSILVLPAVNSTTSVDATDHFRYTITKPLAEKGYYVFPVHLVDSFFKSENLSDAELIRQIPVEKLKKIFNPDAILYVDINAWDTNYSILTSSVDVGLSFSLVSASTGQELWNNTAYAYSASGGNNGGGLIGLIVSAVQAAVNTAVDYTDLAYVSNNAGVSLMPAGEYKKDIFEKDIVEKIYTSMPTNYKDGRLYVDKYFIHGNKKKGDVALTARGRAPGYHGFSIINFSFFNHNGYMNYYLKNTMDNKKHLRNRFFRYENGNPYLLANNKKVFVFTEKDGTIPFSEENGHYYFDVTNAIELKSITNNLKAK